MTIVKKTTLTIAALLTLFSLFALIPNSFSGPIPYQAALSSLLSGLALFSMLHKKGSFITKVLGCLLILNLLLSLFPFSTQKTPHMAVIEMICFGLVGLFCLLWHTNSRSSTFSHFFALFSLLLFFLGTLFILTYFFPLKIPVTWKAALPIHSFFAISICLIGTGLISLNLYWDSQFNLGLTKLKSFILTISFAFFAIAISLGLQEEKDVFVDKLLKAQGISVKNLTVTKLQGSLDLLKGMGSILEKDKKNLNNDWKLNIIYWMNENRAITNFLWLNEDFKEIFRAANLPFYLSTESLAAMKHEALGHDPYITIIPQADHYNLIMCYPLYWDNLFQGEIIEVFDTQKYFENIFSDNIDLITIVKSNNKTISFINTDSEPLPHLKIEIPIFLFNLNLNIFLYPSKTFTVLPTSNTYIYIVLFGGFIIALSLGGLLYQWQQNKLQLSTLQTLENERTFLLTAANIGRWFFDIATKTFKVDSYSLYLLGKEKKSPLFSLDDFFNSILQEDRDVTQEMFTRTLSSSISIDTTFKVRWPNDTIHSILCKGYMIYDKEHLPLYFAGIYWDISQLIQSKELLGTSLAIAKVFAESENLSDSLIKTLQILHRFLGWEILILWLKNGKTLKIQYHESAIIEGVLASSFIETTKKLHTLENQATFPSHVFNDLLPFWTKDITKEPEFKRKDSALLENLHGAVAFPILEGTELTGVVELFKQTHFTDEVTEQLTHFIITVGIQIGQFIQRKGAEKQVLELAHTVKSSTAGIFHTDLEGTVQSWNPGATTIYGWTYEDMIGQPITKIYPKEHLSKFNIILHQLSIGKSVERFQSEQICKDGTKIWVEDTISPMPGINQAILGYSVISLDITKQKNLADTLLKTEKKFHDFVENVEEWIWEIDTHINFTYSNPYISQILGFSEEEIIGKNIILFIPEEDREKVTQEFNLFLSKQKGWSSRTLTFRHKNGSLCYLESNAEPIFDENNQLLGFRGADRDITERINIEKSKNEFISMVSHELRTPLTSIYGSLGLLLEENLSTDHIELLKIAERSCERLITLINDVLDSEKIQLGQFVLKPTLISITKVLEESIQTASSIAENSQITLEKKGPFPEVKVYADPSRLTQVILNILSNAIKFSPKGTQVLIFVTLENNNVKVSIQNEGPGIPKSFQPHIFEKFAQGNMSDTRLSSGTGLGLSIAKSIIDQLNGTIGFISEEKMGSTFFFTLPVKEA